MVLIQLVEGLNRMKAHTHRSKKELPTWVRDLGYQCFSAFRFELKHQLFLGLELAEFQSITTPSGLLDLQFADCRSWDHLHNCASQFLKIDLFLYRYTSCWLYFSGESQYPSFIFTFDFSDIGSVFWISWIGIELGSHLVVHIYVVCSYFCV